MKKDDQREEYLNKIAMLTAENENLNNRNTQLKTENDMLKQQVSTLKSLLSIYELGRKQTPDVKEELSDSYKRFASMSFLRSDKFSTHQISYYKLLGSLNPNEEDVSRIGKFKNLIKAQEKLVVKIFF
jgi:hypothetical protein